MATVTLSPLLFCIVDNMPTDRVSKVADNRNTVVIHAGLRKTGSSFLQTMFALNAKEQQELTGFHYPKPNELQKARRGETSSGNSPHRKFWKALDALSTPRFRNRNVLISREQLFEDVCRSFEEHRVERTVRKIRDFSYHSSLEFVLVLRDPLPWAFSMYNQAVKHEKCSSNFDTWILGEGSRFPARLERTIRDLQNLGVRVSLANYSRQEDNLWDWFLSVLGLDERSSFKWSTAPRVNRSLTAGERRIQVIANQMDFPDVERIIANQFVESARSLASAAIPIRQETYRRFVQEVSQTVASLNALMPEGSALTLGDYRPEWETSWEEDQSTQITIDEASARALLASFKTRLEEIGSASSKRMPSFRKWLP